MLEYAELTSSVVLGMIVSEAIELAKRLKWCPIDYDSESLNRTVGAVAAFLSGLGLSFQFDPVAGRLVIDGLLWGAIGQGFMQWAVQMGYWRLAIRPNQPRDETARPRVIDTGAPGATL